MENIDILYYEYMIESVQEEYKMREALFINKSCSILAESSEEVAICNEGVISSIVDFIKKIFEGIINFFKKIFSFITGKDKDEYPFKIDNDLIKKVEDKIKSIKIEDKNKFKLEKINPVKIIEERSAKCEEYYAFYDEVVKLLMEQIRKAVEELKEKTKTEFFTPHITDEGYEGGKKELNEMLNFDSVKNSFEDVSFNNISDILNKYKNSDSEVTKLKDKLSKNISKLEKEQKELEKIIKKNDISDANSIKQALTRCSEMLTKSLKNEVQLTIKLFKTYEDILKKFVSFGSKEKEEN